MLLGNVVTNIAEISPSVVCSTENRGKGDAAQNVLKPAEAGGLAHHISRNFTQREWGLIVLWLSRCVLSQEI